MRQELCHLAPIGRRAAVADRVVSIAPLPSHQWVRARKASICAASGAEGWRG